MSNRERWITLRFAVVVLVVFLGMGAFIFYDYFRQRETWQADIFSETYRDENFQHLLRPIVGVGFAERNGEEKYATAFFVNDSTIVTSQHVAEAAMKEGAGSYLTADYFFETCKLVISDTRKDIDQLTKDAGWGIVSKPIFSPTAPLAIFRILNTGSCAMSITRYYRLGEVSSVGDGDRVLRVSASQDRLAYHGSPIGFSAVEAVHDPLIESKTVRSNIAVPKELNVSNSIAISGVVAGDSGSPVFYYDKKRKEFLLLGITETYRHVTRVNALKDFLRKNNVPFNE